MTMPRHMVILAALALVVMALLPLSTSKNSTSTDLALDTALQEMQRANYFAFVMLLNMAPAEKLPSNVTFLMPNNRMLAKALIPRNDVLDFLLLHSIPAPLGFEYLNHLPTGSIIPSSEPKFMLKVSNYGRRSFFLNNVRVVSPNVCVAESSIRCHGIENVLQDRNQTPPQPTTNHPPITLAPPPSLPPPPGGDSLNLAPAAAPQPINSDPDLRNSGSSGSASGGGLLGFIFPWVLLSILHWYS